MRCSRHTARKEAFWECGLRYFRQVGGNSANTQSSQIFVGTSAPFEPKPLQPPGYPSYCQPYLHAEIILNSQPSLSR
jgi:hypothetical protein